MPGDPKPVTLRVLSQVLCPSLHPFLFLFLPTPFLFVCLQVACGPWHVAAVASSGQLFTFGDGSFGALGHGGRE